MQRNYIARFISLSSNLRCTNVIVNISPKSFPCHVSRAIIDRSSVPISGFISGSSATPN